MENITVTLTKERYFNDSDSYVSNYMTLSFNFVFTADELNCSWEEASIDTVDKCVRIALNRPCNEDEREYYIDVKRRAYGRFYTKPAEGFDIWARKMLWCSNEIKRGEEQFYLLKKQMQTSPIQ